MVYKNPGRAIGATVGPDAAGDSLLASLLVALFVSPPPPWLKLLVSDSDDEIGLTDPSALVFVLPGGSELAWLLFAGFTSPGVDLDAVA